MILSLALALACQAPPVVVVAPGPARPYVLVIDGKAYSGQTVSIAGDIGPTPPPAPEPPAPKPVPLTGLVHVSLVVAKDDASQAPLRTHADVRALVSNATALHTYDDADPAIDSLKLRGWLKDKPLPVVIIQDQGGKVVESVAVPDAPAIVAAVKRWRP